MVLAESLRDLGEIVATFGNNNTKLKLEADEVMMKPTRDDLRGIAILVGDELSD